MEITVTARHSSISDTLKDYAQTKLESVLEGLHKISSAKVILDIQKSMNRAEIIVHGKNINFEADSESYDMYQSVDLTVDKISKQLHKYFDKIQDHHKNTKLKAEEEEETGSVE
jgi:putative sigma-54 modulation protein